MPESIAAKALGFAGLQALAAVTVTFFLVGRRRKLPTSDKLVVLWLIYVAIVHLTLEAMFVYLSLTGTVNGSSGLFAEIWQEYARADFRWGVSDATVVTLEMWTVLLNGPMCILVAYAILTDKPYRHFVQIVLNVCEIYGGWITFGPEWITGSKNLDTSNFLYTWVYLFFFNFIWVIFPALLLLQSFLATSWSSKKHQN